MRKILLATTALIAFAGVAEAAESPIQVTLGGSVDFRAALFHEGNKIATEEGSRRHGDFQTEYALTIAAEGKAAGGIEYGALLDLNNDQKLVDGNQYGIAMNQAYVWVSSAFGKLIMGDELGASSLFVMAPTVGEGQMDGSYTNFTDEATLAEFKPTYFDDTENDTKVTYFTPKVGTASHKVQLGVSYTAEDRQGTVASLYERTDGYKNQVEATAQYTGTIAPVSVVVTPMIATGEGEGDKTASTNRDYTMWGVGAQALYAGLTFGGSYVDAGHKGSAPGQDLDQDVWTVGLGYEIDKVALATNFMSGEGYYNGLLGSNDYVEGFNAVGFGATYKWVPGLTTAADAVFFNQDRGGTTKGNEGHVLMLTQKMAF
ncbi:MAG: porin [Bdellovibrionales bacterium]|jgi:hypothetical protein